MKRKTVFLIAAGVIAVHAVVFYFIAGWNPLPNVPHIAPPSFSRGWANFTDPATHEKMIYQEFTVNTRMDQTTPTPSPIP